MRFGEKDLALMPFRPGLAFNVSSVTCRLHECEGKHFHLSEPQFSYLKMGISHAELFVGLKENACL